MDTPDNVVPIRPRAEPGIYLDPVQPPSKKQGAMLLLLHHGERGLTSRELAAHFGWHHGSSSSVLSLLHKRGLIARLEEQRDGQRVYVDLHYVNGRQTSRARSQHEGLLDRMADELRRQNRTCSHQPEMADPNCKACDVRALLAEYDLVRGV
jgi:DNA-binding MarR family transcriptional regulator